MSTPTIQALNGGPGTEQARRVTIHTDDAGRDVIKRAATLRLALLGEVSSDDPELHGHALVGIVSEWLRGKASELRESRP